MKKIRMQTVAAVIAIGGLALGLSQAGPAPAAADGWRCDGSGPGGGRCDGSGPGGGQCDGSGPGAGRCRASGTAWGGGGGRGGRGEARGPELPSFGELAAVLRLTDEQRGIVEPALDELEGDLDRRHDRMREHRGDRRGKGRGEPGRGDGGPGPRAEAGDLERPMHDFLVAVVPALGAEQVETLADYMTARHEARREERAGRARHSKRSGRGAGPEIGSWLGGELRRLASELELDDDQRDAVRALLDDRRDEFRALHEGFDLGELSAEQARDQAKALRRSIEEELRGILSEEQWNRLGELRTERQAKMAERRLERSGDRVERHAEFLGAALALDAATSAKVRAVLESSEAEQRALLEKLRDGKVDPEDALYEGYGITQETSGGIAGVLDGEAARKFEALHRLLPGGGRRGR